MPRPTRPSTQPEFVDMQIPPRVANVMCEIKNGTSYEQWVARAILSQLEQERPRLLDSGLWRQDSGYWLDSIE